MSDENSDSENPDINQEVNVNVEQRDSSPSVVVRALWFIFVGSWASGVWLSVAWFLNVTVIGMPLGLKMINKVPWIVSLKSRDVENEVLDSEDGVTVREGTKQQRSILVRGVYFLLVGWWASGIWMGLAWVASVTIVGLPLAIWMYGKLPLVVSLYRY